MDEQGLADKTTNIIIRILLFFIMIGTFGMMKLLYNREIRETAITNDNIKIPFRLFDYKGRAGRLEYIFLQICCGLIALIVIYPFRSVTMDNIIIYPLIFIGLLFLFIMLATSTRRCRDLSISPIIIIILLISGFIPCVGSIIGSMIALALLFLPGGVDYSKITIL